LSLISCISALASYLVQKKEADFSISLFFRSGFD